MKKWFLLFFAAPFGLAQAQTDETPWNLGLHGGFVQYTGDLGQGWYRFDQAAYSFVGFSVSRYLNRHFDVGVLGTIGEAGHMAPRDYGGDPDARYNFLVAQTTINPFLRYNFVGPDAFFRPYLFAGPSLIRQRGLSVDHPYTGGLWQYATPTAGAGFRLRLGSIVNLQFQEMFMYMWRDDVDYTSRGWNDLFLYHTLGLTFNIPRFEKKGPGGSGEDVAKCPKIKTGPQRSNGEGRAVLEKEKKRKGLFRKNKR